MVLIACTAFSQVSYNPNSSNGWYYWTIKTAGAYANDQIDTLPSPSATTPYYKIAGKRFCTLTLSCTDSASGTIFVDTRTRGLTTYSNIVESAFSTTTNAGVTFAEIPLRTYLVDEFLGIDQESRIRVVFGSGDNGVTTPAYTLKINWKP